MRLLACIAALAMLLGPLGSWARSQCAFNDPSAARSCCESTSTPSCCGEPAAGTCEGDADPVPARDQLPCDPGSGCWWLCVALCDAIIDPLPLPHDPGVSVAIALLPSVVAQAVAAPPIRVRPVSGAPPDITSHRLARLCRWVT